MAISAKLTGFNTELKTIVTGEFFRTRSDAPIKTVDLPNIGSMMDMAKPRKLLAKDPIRSSM
jgi:hypothetical protein